eukprot:7156376-Alexandrium_andersonii.AAC.1
MEHCMITALLANAVARPVHQWPPRCHMSRQGAAACLVFIVSELAEPQQRRALQANIQQCVASQTPSVQQ